MKTYSINIRLIIYLLIVYSFFKPYYLSQIGFMPIFNKALFFVTIVLIVFIYLIRLPYIKYNSGVAIIIMYSFTIIMSSIINDSLNSLNELSILLYILGLPLFVNYCLYDKDRTTYFLSIIYFLTYVYVITNLISMIVYPQGIPSITDNATSPQYIFGNTNNLIKIVLPGIGLSFLYDILKYKKIRKITWLLLVLVWISLVKTWSVTSLLGILVFTIILFNKRNNKKRMLLYYFGTLFVSILFTILLVLFQYESELIKRILLIFGKSLTFSNRDILWLNAIKHIKSSLLYGYGIRDQSTILLLIGNKYGAHNYYLDTLFRGGIVTLIIVLVGVIYMGLNILKSNSGHVIKIIIATSAAYFIMWIAEPFHSTEYIMFTIIFIFFSHVSKLSMYSTGKQN